METRRMFLGKTFPFFSNKRRNQTEDLLPSTRESEGIALSDKGAQFGVGLLQVLVDEDKIPEAFLVTVLHLPLGCLQAVSRFRSPGWSMSARRTRKREDIPIEGRKAHCIGEKWYCFCIASSSVSPLLWRHLSSSSIEGGLTKI